MTCEIVGEHKDLAICNSMVKICGIASQVTRKCLLGVLLPHYWRLCNAGVITHSLITCLPIRRSCAFNARVRETQPANTATFALLGRWERNCWSGGFGRIGSACAQVDASIARGEHVADFVLKADCSDIDSTSMSDKQRLQHATSHRRKCDVRSDLLVRVVRFMRQHPRPHGKSNFKFANAMPPMWAERR